MRRGPQDEVGRVRRSPPRGARQGVCAARARGRRTCAGQVARGRLRFTDMGNSVRTLTNPECISADTDRACRAGARRTRTSAGPARTGAAHFLREPRGCRAPSRAPCARRATPAPPGTALRWGLDTVASGQARRALGSGRKTRETSSPPAKRHQPATPTPSPQRCSSRAPPHPLSPTRACEILEDGKAVPGDDRAVVEERGDLPGGGTRGQGGGPRVRLVEPAGVWAGVWRELAELLYQIPEGFGAVIAGRMDAGWGVGSGGLFEGSRLGGAQDLLLLEGDAVGLQEEPGAEGPAGGGRGPPRRAVGWVGRGGAGWLGGPPRGLID